MKRPHDYTVEALTELQTIVGWLADNLVHGVTNRPSKAPALTLERRIELARTAHDERVERTELAPGEGEAPMDLDIMDTLVAILEGSEQMIQRVCTALTITQPTPATSAFTDPRPTLMYLRRLVVDLTDATTAPWVEKTTRDLIETATDVLGLGGDGQVLKAICPWCHGRTEAQPIGGAHTLRIRTVRGMDTTVVTCEGGQCQPPQADCGTWIRGKPAWLQSEWEWLAARLEHTA